MILICSFKWRWTQCEMGLFVFLLNETVFVVSILIRSHVRQYSSRRLTDVCKPVWESARRAKLSAKRRRCAFLFPNWIPPSYVSLTKRSLTYSPISPFEQWNVEDIVSLATILDVAFPNMLCRICHWTPFRRVCSIIGHGWQSRRP